MTASDIRRGEGVGGLNKKGKGLMHMDNTLVIAGGKEHKVTKW